MAMAPDGSEKFDGKWHTHYFCTKCDHRVTHSEKMNSDGCCPYCGHGVIGRPVMDTILKSMKWVAVERKWWQVWRIFKGTFEETPNRVAGKRPLCDVTVFRGPNGVFAVTLSPGDIWSVEKAPEDLEHIYSHGVTNVKTIFPKAKGDEHKGSFDSRKDAMKAARKWAGVEILPTYPAPNRRAAIAHTKAQS